MPWHWLSRRLLPPLVATLMVGLLPADSALAQAAEPTAAPARQPSWQTGAPALPKVTARAAVLVEASSGRLLFARSPNDRLAVASLTKMVTALVAIDQGVLSQPIEATEYARSVPTVIGLDPGDVLTLEEMLYGLILRSGNDAALAIAEALGGGHGPSSINRFVGMMNDKVWDMGLRHTHFVNPNGLDADGHYSSAYDIAQISRAFLAQPELARIAATPVYTIDKPPGWVFENLNAFLSSYPGANGIKTGYEDRAGRCLAASATRDGRELIAVVLNSEQLLPDAVNLMDYGFAVLDWLSARPTAEGQAA